MLWDHVDFLSVWIALLAVSFFLPSDLVSRQLPAFQKWFSGHVMKGASRWLGSILIAEDETDAKTHVFFTHLRR